MVQVGCQSRGRLKLPLRESVYEHQPSAWRFGFVVRDAIGRALREAQAALDALCAGFHRRRVARRVSGSGFGVCRYCLFLYHVPSIVAHRMAVSLAAGATLLGTLGVCGGRFGVYYSPTFV